jgi:putative CocE/NonD family hydrolase
MSCQRSVAHLIAVSLLIVVIGNAPAPTQAQERVSSFGRYSGYSEAAYDGWSRRSEYVTMPDGVDLAVFYFIPTLNGEEAAEALPVILLYTRYLRAWETDDGVETFVDNAPFVQDLVQRGYVFAIANTRGSGSSFGVRHGEFSAEEAADSYEIIEWLAAQTWSDGNVGMWGRSYSGMTGYHAATQAPPHLKAVVSEMAGPVLYDFVYPGGVYRRDFVREWSRVVESMDDGTNGVPARVEADADGVMRDAAVAEHADNFRPVAMAGRAKYRNSSPKSPLGVRWSWEMASSIYGAEAIKGAEIPIYHLLGWYDIYTTQQSLMYENLKPGPQKMMIGPWTHSGGIGGDVHTAELLRWFDYWLKGIDNGVMREKPVHYYLMRGTNTVPDSGLPVSQDEIDAEDGRRWKATKVWPPKKAKAKTYYLSGGRSGTVASVNDGRLATTKARKKKARDRYPVDYSSTMGSYSRWMDGHGFERPDGTRFFDERTSENEKALTYTSTPFARNMAIAGSPIVHLWVTSTHKDGDFFVYLEEIEADGSAHYISEGMLRASHRVLSEAPWSNLGLPFHRSFKKDRLKKMPADPVELVFDLLGTATLIDQGHRVRVTITGADTPHHALYPNQNQANSPTITIFRDRQHGSFIELPMMKAK